MHAIKLLAGTALLALAAPVMAQSSVTLYGRLNLTIESQDFNSGDRTTNFVSNGSRVGFKGSEDLGDGMRAGFVIEHGFNAATGAANSVFWGRQAEVNLSGSFGTIRMGSFTSEAYFATADYISLHNHDTGTSADVLYADVRGFQQTDKVGYTSPSLGGLVVHVAVSATDSGEPDRTGEIAANYDAGPLHLGLGIQKQGDKQQFAVRGLYELGDFTLGAYVQRDKNVYLPGSRTSYRLSGMYTMGASEFHVNVGVAGDYKSLEDSGASQYTLGYNYNLSKRTKVYGFWTKVADDDDLLVYGGTRTSVAGGIRHNF